jgi:hypothetical protein
MHRNLRVILTVVPLTVIGLLAPVAGASGGPRFTAPLSWGSVDFGDRVLYRLAGSGCVGTPVRVHVGGGGRPDAVGPVSTAAADPLSAGTCVGIAQVPSEAQVRATRWAPGDPLTVRVVSPADSVSLRYQRIEVDQGTPASGKPTAVTPPVRDPRAGPGDKAMSMSTGDVVSIGRVDLTKIYSVSLRVCVPQRKPHVTPTRVELRAGGPNAPSIIGTVDVADDLNNANKSNFGWPNCWQTQPWPIINKVPGRDPALYVAVQLTALPIEISWMDVNGTGAKVPDAPPTDPAGTQRIFEGSYAGWTHSHCALDDDGSVRQAHTRSPENYAPLATEGFVGEQGCTMTYTARKLHNVMIRFAYRMQSFEDNGAIYVGGHEIQMREAGEFLTGGIQGNTVPDALTGWAVDNPVSGYPAQRIKSNSYPDWSQIEIVQIGSRYIVRINGRTVTDCSTCLPDPAPYNFEFQSQPNFSYTYGVGFRMDTGPTNPVTDNPSNWGNLSFKNVRVYNCTSPTDPVCVGGPGVNGLPS